MPTSPATERLRQLRDASEHLGSGVPQDTLERLPSSKGPSWPEILAEMGWENLDEEAFLNQLTDTVMFQVSLDKSSQSNLSRSEAFRLIKETFHSYEVLDKRFQLLLTELGADVVYRFSNIPGLQLIIAGSVGTSTNVIRLIVGETRGLPDLDVSAMADREITSEEGEQLDSFIKKWLLEKSTNFGFEHSVDLCWEHTPKKFAHRLRRLDNNKITILLKSDLQGSLNRHTFYGEELINYLLPSYPDDKGQNEELLKQLLIQMTDEQYQELEEEFVGFLNRHMASIKEKHVFNLRKILNLVRANLLGVEVLQTEESLKHQVFANIVEKISHKFVGKKYITKLRQLRGEVNQDVGIPGTPLNPNPLNSKSNILF